MADVFISKKEILEVPPFIRDAYLKAHQEGQQEGWHKGQQEGQTQGFLRGKVESILNLLRLRFVLKGFEHKALQAIFSDMDNDTLDKTLEKAVEVADLDAMKTWLVALDA